MNPTRRPAGMATYWGRFWGQRGCRSMGRTARFHCAHPLRTMDRGKGAGLAHCAQSPANNQTGESLSSLGSAVRLSLCAGCSLLFIRSMVHCSYSPPSHRGVHKNKGEQPERNRPPTKMAGGLLGCVLVVCRMATEVGPSARDRSAGSGFSPLCPVS